MYMVNKKMHLVEKRSDASFYLKFFLRAATDVLSVRILAKISPRGKARMISIAAANQDAEVCRDITPRL